MEPTMRLSRLDLQARQLTPPDSPKHESGITLPPIRNLWEDASANTHSKMSLKFIAPSSGPNGVDVPARSLDRLMSLSDAAAMHRGSRLSSPMPLATSSTYSDDNAPKHSSIDLATRLPPALDPSCGLPSPLCSPCVESTRANGKEDHRLGLPIIQGYGFRPTCAVLPAQPRILFTPPGFREPRINKCKRMAGLAARTGMTATASRSERHPYGAEERYALLYLRREQLQKGLEWKEAMDRFHLLFPPNTRRRPKTHSRAEPRNLPECYPERGVQGLQCRFYRLRDEEKLPKSREQKSGPKHPATREEVQKEEEVIAAIARRDAISPQFAEDVHRLSLAGPGVIDSLMRP